MRPGFLVFALLLILSHTYAQILPQVQKRIYSSPSGKIYIQKSLPLYLLLSTDSTTKNCIALTRNGSSCIPFYLTAEGLNVFRTPSAVDKKTRKIKLPKEDVIFEVYADSHAPVSRFAIEKGETKFYKDIIFTQANAQFQLNAHDELSGVDKILYSIDSSSFREYSSPIVLEKEKTYKIKYLSTDRVGNMENPNSCTIVVDNSSPTTTMDFKGDKSEDIFSGNSTIFLKSTDKISGVNLITVLLDGKPVKKFSGSIYTGNLDQGEHKLEYYSTDQVNNKETSHVYNFSVDRTPPVILQDIVGKTFVNNGKEYSSGHSNLKITTLDNKAGVKEVYYSINQSEYKLYEKPVLLNTLKGKISVRAYAVDKVNNRRDISDEASSHQFSYIDLTGPQLGYRFSGPVSRSSDTIYVCSKTKIQLYGYDSESGFRNVEYAIDQKETIPYKGEFSIADEGFHSIGYTGYDNVENTSMDAVRVMVDNSGPVIHTQFSTTPKGKANEKGTILEVYPSHVGLFAAATDTESGYERMTYQINGAPEKPFAGFINGFKGVNTVIIKAYDKLGNTSTCKVEFIIKN